MSNAMFFYMIFLPILSGTLAVGGGRPENLVLDAFHSCLCARSLPFRFMSYLAWTCIEVVHLCILPTLLSLELSAPTVYSDLLLEQQA